MNVPLRLDDSRAAPAFPCQSPFFLAPTRTSAISIARFRADASDSDVVDSRMDVEDAFVALFQLRDHPVHEFRLDGKLVPVVAAPRGGLQFIDLRAQVRGRLRHPVDTLLLHMPRALLDEVAEEANAPRIEQLVVPEPWQTLDPVLNQLQGLLVEATQSARNAGSLLYDHLAIGVASHFAAAYGGLRRRFQLSRGGLAPWQERRAKELLASDLARDLSLHDIARECDLSPAYFGRAFKVSVGLSPHAWRQGRRIDQAKALLRSGDVSLAEIAMICGFADQSHFSRVFARQTKATPGGWRRVQREIK